MPIVMEQLTVPSDPRELWKFFIDVCSIANLPPTEALIGMLTACVVMCKAPPENLPPKTAEEWIEIATLVWDGFRVQAIEVTDASAN